MNQLNGQRLPVGQRRLSRTLVYAMTLVAAACSPVAERGTPETSTDTAATRANVLGCYRLRAAPFTTPGRSGAGGDLLPDGVLFQLDSLPLGTAAVGHLRRVTLLVPDSAQFPVRFWSADSTNDSIGVTIGTGHAGYRFALLPGALTADGSVTSYPERSSAERTTHVTFTRTTCAAKGPSD